jgi:hypothetical protein
MINVATPWVLWVAAAGALMTAVLHFISVKRPPAMLLPTARFLPDRAVRAVSRSAKPSDPLLLLLRVVALLLAGIALAGVTVRGARTQIGRVVIIDRGGAPADSVGLRAAALAVLRRRTASTASTGASGGQFAGTRIVTLDSTARVMSIAEMRAFNPDTMHTSHAGATVSSAILAGIRAASAMVRDETDIDSVELVLVSGANHGPDASLSSVRTLWPGRLELVPIARSVAGGESVAVRAVARFIGAAPNAAVLSAVGPAAIRGRTDVAPRAAASTATVRDSAAVDSVLIDWPATGVPASWTAEKPDTIGAIVANGVALVSPFVRLAKVPTERRGRARVIAWWSDGEVAAIEIPGARGCTRQVAVVVPPYANVLQGSAARPLLGAVVAPCGGRIVSAPLTPAERSLLSGSGGAASARAFRTGIARRTPFGSVMLLVALLLLAVEWWIRDRDGLSKAFRALDPPLRKAA